ncbi:60S ribosomal protein L15 [Tanacetum coccineum]
MDEVVADPDLEEIHVVVRGSVKSVMVILFDAGLKNEIVTLTPPTSTLRELRGLESAGKKYKALCGKGHLNLKQRPSRRAPWKRNTCEITCDYTKNHIGIVDAEQATHIDASEQETRIDAAEQATNAS